MTYALSIRQTMVPLCHGATVVMASTAQIAEPLTLFQLIKDHRVTRVDFVPSYWRSCTQALEALGSDERAELLDNHLRHIVCVGEPLRSDIPRTWSLDFEHDAQLTNIFGQTETTGLVTAYSIPTSRSPRTEEASTDVVPVGRPTADTKLYVVDATMQPVPAGVVGELWVSNPSVVRGYWNRPELTAERFVPNPFIDGQGGEPPHARLYRTGDRARIRLDGNLELLGRSDHQVKLRGVRVELGEIEAAVLRHEAVRQCVVTLEADGTRHEERSDSRDTASKRLVAFYVAPDRLLPADLRSFLRGTLPEHMMPAIFVRLERMPATPNGKVDRRALPTPSSAEDRAAYMAPETRLERAICDVLQDYLQVGNVGVQDYFLDLGLHSLRLVEFRGRLERRLGDGIEMMQLLTNSTVRSLASSIGSQSGHVPPIERATSVARAEKRAAMRQSRRQRRRAREHRLE